MAFTDGRHIGGTLDRNGLRPARYIVTDDDLVVMASEVGVLPIPESKIIKKWRLQPGKMFLIDLEQGRIIDDEELKNHFASAKPYRRWIESVRIKLEDVPAESSTYAFSETLLDRQQLFGYSQEDIKFLMSPMAQVGEEATGSMGNDSPLAVLSDKNKTLYNYFKQLFAQVTNPPIDPLREERVMSLRTRFKNLGNILAQDATQPGEDRVRLTGVRCTAPVPVVEGLVGGVGQIGVVALVHRHPMTVARQHERSERAGHTTADDGDVLRVGRAGQGLLRGVSAHDLQAPEEVDERLVHLIGALLLGPVAAALEDDRAAQLRQGSSERGDRGRAPDGGAVTVAADEQRRHVDPRSTERGEVLPVAVDVAVAVERAAQSTVLELAGVRVDVGGGEPR
jgi:hypothetical protein